MFGGGQRATSTNMTIHKFSGLFHAPKHCLTFYRDNRHPDSSRTGTGYSTDCIATFGQ